jgi:outer membrane receptor for Fe3+-dicitrate
MKLWLILPWVALAAQAGAYEENPTLTNGPQSSDLAQDLSKTPAAAVSVSANAASVAQVEAEEYVIRGRAANLLGKASSASSGSVSSEDLSNRSFLRPAEVLEAVPGLLITQHSGDGKANQYFTRGFNLDHGTDFSFNVDGVPVNLPSHAHGQGYTDLNFLIPELVKEVAYTKGPNNPEYGDMSTAGSANFVYPLRLAQDLASLTLGEYGYLRALAAGSAPLLDGTMLWAIEGSAYDGPWSTPENNKKYNGLLRYSLGGQGKQLVLTASVLDSSWTATNQVPQAAVESGEIGPFGTENPSDGGNTKRESFWAHWQGAALGGTGSLMGYVTVSHLQLWNDFTFFLVNPAQGDQVEEEDERTVTGVKVRERYEFSLGGLRGINEIGLDFRNDNVTTLALYDTVDRVRWQSVQDNHVVETQEAAFLRNTCQWAPWLRSELSMRQDFFQMDVMGNSPDGNADPAIDGKAEATVPEPKASLALRPWEGPAELYVNYGWSFHSNDARIITPQSLAQAGGGAQASPLVQAKGAEAGLRLAEGSTYEATLAAFRLDLQSELTFNGDTAYSTINGPSTRQGLEVSNTFRAAPFYLDLDYAWSQARFDSLDTVDDPAHPGIWVPEAVENVGTATLGLDHIHGWSLDFRARYFGSRALTADNQERSPALTLCSLRLSREFSKSVTLNADIFNVFNVSGNDVSYYYLAQLKGQTAQEDFMVHPTEPRSLRMTMVSRF